MDTRLLDYDLPQELIAQEPAPRRDGSRLLVIERATGRIGHRHFSELPELLEPGDLLVRNTTRVVPARVDGLKTASSGRVEVLFLRALGGSLWEALVRPRRRLREGLTMSLLDGRLAVRIAALEPGETLTLEVLNGADVSGLLDAYGKTPLPPYIRREARPDDRERYQTTYADAPGSVAAPTAGLHFTPGVLGRLATRGVGLCDVVLHVGWGTFKPVRCGRLEEHEMHSEPYEIPDRTARTLTEARGAGRRVVAVGTTAVRSLESAWDGRQLAPGWGETSLYILPGFRFAVTDALLTNFHAPRSTLLALVMAFAGEELIRRAYAEAVERRYRFLSYGDATLVL